MNIKISVVDQKGSRPCHRGHKIGDSFDYENDRGKICPLAMHMLFPMIDIIKYGGKLNSDCFCCPDVDTINVFKLEKSD